MMSQHDILWPSGLLDVVRAHLEAVENAENPEIPPLASPEGVNIFDFFTSSQQTLVDRLGPKGVQPDTVEFCVGFVIEVLEHASQLSFLTPKERRAVGVAVRQMEKRSGLPKARAGVGKRRRGNDSEALPDDGVKYCRVLSLEYLLRFFISMPLIVDHYDKLGGSAIPAFCKRPLWLFASETLQLLDTMPERFHPRRAYTPIKRQRCSMCFRHLRKRDRESQNSVGDETAPQRGSGCLETQRSTQVNGSQAVSDKEAPCTGKKNAVTDTSAPSVTPPQNTRPSLSHGKARKDIGTGMPEAAEAGQQPKQSDAVQTLAGRKGLSEASCNVARLGEGAPCSTVSSLFSTAAGKPIAIREDLLREAEEQFKKMDNPAKGQTVLELPVPQARGGVADPLASAYMTHVDGFGHMGSRVAEGAPVPPSMAPTLFATASGVPVSVSAASLAAAQRKWRELAPLDGRADETADPLPMGGQSGAPQGSGVACSPAESAPSRFQSTPMRPVSATLGANGSSAGRSLGLGGASGSRPFQPPRQAATVMRQDLVKVTAGVGTVNATSGVRRPFVPPLQRAPASSTGAPAAAERAPGRHYAAPSAAVPPCPILARSAAQSKVQAVSFPYQVYDSAAADGGCSPSTIPTLSELTTGAFRFHLVDCGAALAALLGFAKLHAPPTTPILESHWRHMMLALGASEAHCTTFWCRENVQSSLLQLWELCADESSVSADKDGGSAVAITAAVATRPRAFNPTSLALLLCLRYNREVVEGERPALRCLVEGDIPPASLMVLSVSAVSDDRAAPHIRIVQLSDGFYHMRASLDVPLSALVREGILSPGRRLAVCGARLLIHGQGTPEEFAGQTVLSVNYNCVRPVHPRTPLGLGLAEPAPLPIHLVHPQGGLVPALQGIVARVLPAFYVSQSAESGDRRSGTGPKMVRNGNAQMSHYSKLTRVLAAEHEESACRERGGCLAGEVPKGAVNARPAAATGIRVSRVVSTLIQSSHVGGGAPTEALIQHWETYDDEEACLRAGMREDDGDAGALPKEGAEIVVYALNPARSQTAAAPFAHAKLFYAARALRFSAVKRSSAPTGQTAVHPSDSSGMATRLRRTYLRMHDATELSLGSVVDVLGLYIGSLATPQGTLSLLLLLDGTYALFQVPLAAPTREISLPLPPVDQGGAYTLLIQNGTFISREDSQAGSDCARVFANEYTAVSTRITRVDGPAGEALHAEQVVGELTGLFRKAVKRHTARRDEIFRCCVEEAAISLPAGTARGSVIESPLTAAAALSTPVGSLSSAGPSVPNDSLGPTAVNEKRLPYYLRNRPAVGSDGGAPRRRGVIIPAASMGSPTQLPPAVIDAAGATTETSFHFFGNVISLELVLARAEDPNDRSQVVFSESASSFAGFAELRADPREGLCGVRVTWCFGTVADVRSAVIRDGPVLDALLNPCVSATRLSYLCGSDKHPELAQRRGDVLTEGRAASGTGVWWTLFRASVLHVGCAAPSDAVVPWTREEWLAALQMLREKLAKVLFKFTLDESGDTVKRVYYIRDQCPVTELFS